MTTSIDPGLQSLIALSAGRPLAVKALRELRAEIARCHARLEIDHVFVADGDGLKRQDIPCAERATATDGITCRDETIKQLERVNAELRRDAARYRWLRDNKNAYPLFFIAQRSPQNIVVQFTGALADANIDEMMK